MRINIFREFLNDFMVIYLDDILMFSKNPKEHEKHVHLVNKFWGKNNMKNWKMSFSSIGVFKLHHP